MKTFIRTELPKGSIGGLWHMIQTPDGYRKELIETAEEATAKIEASKTILTIQQPAK